MQRLFKALFYLIVLGCIALVAFAYVAPVLGIDLAPTTQDVRIPVDINAD